MITAFFDGSCYPVNPGGTAQWGFAVLNEDDQVIHTDHGIIGRGPQMTNNVAEYHGLLNCLSYLSEYYPSEAIEVFGDSKMVVMMTTGAWGKKKPHKDFPHLIPLLEMARVFYNSFDSISLSWIPRDKNQLADYLSKVQ